MLANIKNVKTIEKSLRQAPNNRIVRPFGRIDPNQILNTEPCTNGGDTIPQRTRLFRNDDDRPKYFGVSELVECTLIVETQRKEMIEHSVSIFDIIIEFQSNTFDRIDDAVWQIDRSSVMWTSNEKNE